MIKLSAVVLTKNEEKNIIDCLDSLSFCDEIIVIDDYSSDKTVELIEKYKQDHKNVFIHSKELKDDFSEQRNFGLGKAKNQWILFVDADERVTSNLAKEILDNVSEDFSGFLIPRIDFMWGKPLMHGETGNIKLLRLFNKEKGQLRGKVHETWVSDGRVESLGNPLLHYPHSTIAEFLKEINFYTDLRSHELYDQSVKSNFLTIFFYPKIKFVINYFWKLGIMDGIPGLIHAILMSFHSFLVRAKLWMLWQKR